MEVKRERLLKEIRTSDLVEKYRRDAREKAGRTVFGDGYFSDDEDLVGVYTDRELGYRAEAILEKVLKGEQKWPGLSDLDRKELLYYTCVSDWYTELAGLSVKELRVRLEEIGLSTKGQKGELIVRFLDHEVRL